MQADAKESGGDTLTQTAIVERSWTIAKTVKTRFGSGLRQKSRETTDRLLAKSTTF